MVQDLYQFLENQEIEKAILIGHSMGGKTVMHFAKKYPEKVDALIVLDIAPKSYVSLAKKASIHHYVILNSMRSIDFGKVKSRKEIDNQLAENIEDERIRMFLLKNIHRNKNNRFSWRLNVEALYKHIDEIMNGELSVEEPITGFPVLFVRGADSNYILDEDFEKIKELFPYAELKTIKNAGHWLHAEQPEALLKIIKDFLNS
jgi:pimeloyl-ACP methyl ester carboxylesterase